MNYPASLIALVQEGVARTGRLGATGLTRIPDLAVAVPALAAGVPGESPAPPLNWNESGYAFALYGQERLGTAAMFAAVELKLQLNGTRDVITAGEAGPAFFPFLGLFGQNPNWFPLTIRVEKKDVWQVTYRNFAAVVANPTVGIAFLSDVKMAQMAEQLQKAGRI